VVNDWDVAVVGTKDSIKAVWPFFIRRKGPWKFVANPHFTPYTGPFLIYPEGQKMDSRISYENKVYAELIDQLPSFSELSQNFHLTFNNSLAFHWKGFIDEKRFTYILSLNSDKKNIWDGFRENTRRQIRKAEKSIKCSEYADPTTLEHLLKDTYLSQASAYPNFPSILFDRIINYIQENSAGKMLVAKDEQENIHACILMVWDEKSAYYLIGGSATAHKNSGAMSLLMWEAICVAKKAKKDIFNFEGSSIESIEKYLRGFGGNLMGFSRITKMNSTSLETLKKLK